ncbi:gibberellin-regulated protein 11-like [Phalaenopsis equestris]|uniref:gibberellin-regulated protein 11-like n=1 Tax=Phalaenopsis equestris TaxID=78828 RepID=UPI0009E4239C|nr:gibberellin-regulated protein 11-like [Phalaenopsis equestris]
MAFPKAFLGWICLAFVILHLADGGEENGGSKLVDSTQPSSLLAKIDCNGECSRRCQLSSRQNLCKRACGTCCVRCNCVPPGTSGNEELCPCYNNMTTHGGRKKCP